jgi:4-hydroxymandelate oxidase
MTFPSAGWRILPTPGDEEPSGALLRDPIQTVVDYECRARGLIAPTRFEQLFGTAGDPHWSTYTRNLAGFRALRLRPRVLVGVAHRQTATTVLGNTISLPVMLGPAGQQKGMHEDAELALARAAGGAGTIMVVPCSPAYGFEEVAEVASGPLWYQVFIHKDRELTEYLVRRALETGYQALVLTVSQAGAPTWRHRALSSPRSPQEVPSPVLAGINRSHIPSAREMSAMIDPAVNWSDIEWLRSIVKIPLVIKGIQTAEDALLCVEHGVDALVVSNHGGRFLQSCRGTVETLPEVAEAVGDRLEIYLDGGIREGTDILKAVALGARAVLIGRPWLWALAVDGEAGVRNVIEILRYELDAAMGLCGLTDITKADGRLVQFSPDVAPKFSHHGAPRVGARAQRAAARSSIRKVKSPTSLRE